MGSIHEFKDEFRWQEAALQGFLHIINITERCAWGEMEKIQSQELIDRKIRSFKEDKKQQDIAPQE